MKRSRQIRLVLMGSLAGGAITGCAPEDDRAASLMPPVSDQMTYTNNHHVPGVGYYHAPYHAWYPIPFNFHSPDRGYYHGDRWTAQPNQAGLTASRPTPQAAQAARAEQGMRSTAQRGGFGSSLFRGGG